MAHRAAHDAAQDVSPALIRRQDAISNQEGRCAQMVGDDAEGGKLVACGLRTIEVFLGRDQRFEEIDVVIVVDALQDGRNPLQTHAGINGGLGEIFARAIGLLVELHENEVPDFDEPVAILIRAAGRASGNAFAMIIEDFGTRAARTGVTHGPEIVRCADPDDPGILEAGDLFPERCGFIVFGIDRDEEFFRVEREFLGAQLPTECDCVFLEIVAEGKIPEHFEKGMVAGRVADIVEVIVLAAGANAFLRCRRARAGGRLGTGKDVLERHHAGIDEEQGGIVLRDERRRCLTQVPSLLEEGKKGLANLVYAGHGQLCVLAISVAAESIDALITPAI